MGPRVKVGAAVALRVTVLVGAPGRADESQRCPVLSDSAAGGDRHGPMPLQCCSIVLRLGLHNAAAWPAGQWQHLVRSIGQRVGRGQEC